LFANAGILMNRLYLFLTAASVVFSGASIASFAQAPSLRKDTPIKIIEGGNRPRSHPKFLTVVKSRLRFVQAGEGSPAKPGGSDLSVEDCNCVFVLDGSTLRVRIVPPEGRPRETLSKRLLAMEGWYVTADYSTKPPSIVLAEKPTRYSRWLFIDARAAPSEGRCYFIKNENNREQNVWLGVESDDKTSNRGYVRRPILHSKKTCSFRVVYDDTDGSR
jgi:hypothetical protein